MSEQENTASRNRAAVEAAVNRIASDPAYRQELLDNPAQALQALGLAPSTDDADVSGYLFCSQTGMNCTYTCIVGTTCGSGSTCRVTCDITN